MEYCYKALYKDNVSELIYGKFMFEIKNEVETKSRIHKGLEFLKPVTNENYLRGKKRTSLNSKDSQLC